MSASTDCLPPRGGKVFRPRAGRAPLWVRCVATSVVALLAWIPCEVLGGLAFLGLNVRLWAYRITPLFWETTSLAGWGMVFAVLGGNCSVYLLCENRAGVVGPRRWLYRGLFLVVSGPVNEVVWNSVIWSAAGTPLYQYVVLPTFGGSGSYLSPLYYLTLLLGFWLDERVPGTLAFGKHRA
ncbi:MAG TPA: hypothetical protein VKA46_19835 [Gemmataceae bacterium]|nr:hypothetical protein [Gemmataceae bacterium]